MRAVESVERSTFFIAGTPRSRTAWMANFFDTGHVSCRHELLSLCSDLGVFAARLASLPGPIAGTSDTLLAEVAESVISGWPQARWAVVEETPEKIAASFAEIGVNDGLAVAHHALLRTAELKKMVPAFCLGAGQLDDIAAVRELWQHCTGGEPFPEERYLWLRELQVEIVRPKFGAWLEARRANIESLVRSSGRKAAA